MVSKRAGGDPGRRDAVKTAEGFLEQKALPVREVPIWKDPGSEENPRHHGRGVPISWD